MRRLTTPSAIGLLAGLLIFGCGSSAADVHAREDGPHTTFLAESLLPAGDFPLGRGFEDLGVESGPVTDALPDTSPNTFIIIRPGGYGGFPSACFFGHNRYFFRPLTFCQQNVASLCWRGGGVYIGGFNYDTQIPIRPENLTAIQYALQGRLCDRGDFCSRSTGVCHACFFGFSCPLKRLNLEFVQAQLSCQFAGGFGSPAVIGALNCRLTCFGLNFFSIRLSNGFICRPETTLDELFWQIKWCIWQRRTADMAALAQLCRLLNLSWA